MAFPIDGSNHREGVQAEKDFGKFIPQLEKKYGKKITKVIHKGGTKSKIDVCIIFESGEIKNTSLKKKKTVTKGSFDYANTTNFSESSFTETKKIIKKYRRKGDNTLKSKFEESVYSEMKKMTSEQITSLFKENVINKYNNENADLIILDEKTQTLHLIKPPVFELIKQGYLLSLCNSTKGKTSSKLMCISPNGDELDLGLRIRVHLNNGYSKLINKNDGNSSLCIKFQQDSVHKLINSNSNAI
jgi:hypothetical protein